MISDHPNWLFLCFCRGAFGHQLGRALMTSPDVHWYDHKINGDNPWDWNHFPTELGWQVSLAHWTRVFNLNGSGRIWDHRAAVPAVGDIAKTFYVHTQEDFDNPVIQQLLDEKYVLVASHDTPEFLRKEFPNSKIVTIDVDDHDWTNVVRNHITASGNYRAFLAGANTPGVDEQKNWYINTFRNTLRDWQQHKLNLTEEQWIEWTVNHLKMMSQRIHEHPECIDYTFRSSNRNDANRIVDIHNALGIQSNLTDIQKVLDAFNLDARISKYL